jgi:hypothetical protein
MRVLFRTHYSYPVNLPKYCMILSQIFESELSDSVARNQAARAHAQIRYWLEENSDRIDKRLPSISDGPLTGGYMMQSSVCDLDGDFPDLIVVFTPKNNTDLGGGFASSGGFYVKEGRRIIVIPCLIAPFDPTHLSTRFGVSGKTPFIHEFMHYLMSRENKGSRLGSSSKVGDDQTDYFNDTDETNAYYQEAAHKMLDLVRSIVAAAPLKAKEWSKLSTVHLMNYVKRTCVDKAFLNHATPKTMRAFDKRLARFVEETIRPKLMVSVDDQ